jgi:hypothetical protein
MAGSSQGSVGSQAAMEVDVEDEIDEDEGDVIIHREPERKPYGTLSSMRLPETEDERRARIEAADMDSDNDAFDTLTNHQRKSLGTSISTPACTNILFNVYIYMR